MNVKVLDASTIVRTQLGQARIVTQPQAGEETRLISNYTVTSVLQHGVSGWKIAYEHIVFWKGHNNPEGEDCVVMPRDR